jgi:hypothetical protein
MFSVLCSRDYVANSAGLSTRQQRVNMFEVETNGSDDGG